MGNVHDNLKNASYTPGSGVGSTSISVRRAKLRQSSGPAKSLCPLQILPGNSRANDRPQK
jgi:hypothetical protein